MELISGGTRTFTLLARYRPSIAASLLPINRWGRRAGTALDEFVAAAVPGGPPISLVAPSARQALLAHYLGLRARRGSGAVLLSAQVCPVVPAAIRAAGLEPVALDSEGGLATTGPLGFADAIGRIDAIGILIAPLYGYLHGGWDSAVGRIPASTDVCLDLAQAPLASAELSGLVRRADALVFSFGLGKLFDTGGGLLLTRHDPPAPRTASAARVRFGTFSRALLFRIAVASGLYRLLLPMVDRMAAEDTEVRPAARTDAAIAGAWVSRLPVIKSELVRAGERSAALGRMGCVQDACHAVEATCSSSSTPLRQLLRLRTAARRDAVVTSLRRTGLDCAPGGEPFPVPDAPQLWPQARAFTSDALRLPFLGRLTDAEFRGLVRSLERVLARA